MILNINTQTEVNESQYKLIQSRYSWLIACRKKDERFFIKPLLFLGYKQQIENILNKLS